MAEFINKYILGVSVPLVLIFGGIYFTFKLRAFHFTRLRSIIKVLTRKNTSSGISPYRAVTLALAGTLGVGNIVGVTSAVCYGGFGAIFWMWVSALCAMVLKYAEILLAVKHRRFDGLGQPHGAAMYYIEDFFKEKKFERVGKIVASVFSLLFIADAFSMGSIIQSKTVIESFDGVFGFSPYICSAILSMLCFIIISKGTKFMSRFTEILVPFMSFGYIILSLAVLILKRSEIIPAFSSIVKDAFNFKSATGGIFGFLFSKSLRYGTMRGLMSNEAGCGTAPTAHASSNTNSAVEQGFWGIFEVFADTVILCTVTALTVIINFDSLTFKGSFILMTFEAYSCVLGKYSSVFLCIAVLCFGFATTVCWAHYGIESVNYLSKNKIFKKIFTLIYSISVFFAAFVSQDTAWQVADFSIGFMTLINVAFLLLMKKEIKKETNLYFK